MTSANSISNNANGNFVLMPLFKAKLFPRLSVKAFIFAIIPDWPGTDQIFTARSVAKSSNEAITLFGLPPFVKSQGARVVSTLTLNQGHSLRLFDIAKYPPKQASSSEALASV